MTKRIISFISKNTELVSYALFGVLTTGVDFCSYIIMTRFFSINEHLSNIYAQIIAILFAFFTNKFFVFKDKNCEYGPFILQFIKFVSLRLISLFVNSILFSLMIQFSLINDILAKVIVALIVVALNYIFSKFFIFKKDIGEKNERSI